MLKKLFVTILVASMISTTVSAQEPQKGSAVKSSTIDELRKKTFNNARSFINTSQFPKYDPDFAENQKMVMKGGGVFKNRSITVFSANDYSVATLCDKKIFFYHFNGELYKLSIKSTPAFSNEKSCPVSYPSTGLSYAIGQGGFFPRYRNGQLIRVDIILKRTESFAFLPNGALSSHWKDDNCYRADGSSCGVRLIREK